MPLRLGPLLQHLVSARLDVIERYVDEMASALERTANDLSASLAKGTSGLSPEQVDELYEFHSDQWFELTDDYPRFFYNSAFITLVSFVEHELMRVVQHAEHRHRSAIGTFAKLPRKSTLESIAFYLKRVPGFVFPDTSAEWSKLILYNRVRNAIVHQFGEAGGHTTPDAASFLTTIGAITTSDTTIRLAPAICRTAIADIRVFFQMLTASIPSSLDIR